MGWPIKKKNRYQVTFSASSSFIIGLIWATPRPLNGPTILINASSSGASNIATDVCLPISRYRLMSFTSGGYLKCFQSSITLWVFSGPNLNQRINSILYLLILLTTPAALNCVNENAGEHKKHWKCFRALTGNYYVIRYIFRTGSKKSERVRIFHSGCFVLS